MPIHRLVRDVQTLCARQSIEEAARPPPIEFCPRRVIVDEVRGTREFGGIFDDRRPCHEGIIHDNNSGRGRSTAPSLSSAISCSRPCSSAAISPSALQPVFDRLPFGAACVLPDFVRPLADALFVPPAFHFILLLL
jgi:hypothetical protein